MTELDPTWLGAAYRRALYDDCIPFWFPRCIDEEYGGFLHCRDRTGVLVDDDKSVWAQGRMAWMLATLHNEGESRPEHLAWATQGLEFLEKRCTAADGRLYFQVTRDGRPLRMRRYAYSEAFAAIAFAAHARATGSGRSAGRSRDLFDRFVKWNFTPGLAPPKFTDARPAIGLAPRIITIATAQELQRNLGADGETTSWIDRCVDEIERLFVKPDLQCVMESVGSDGEIHDHFDGRLLNPGHALEGAWFILAEAQARDDSRLAKLGVRMLDWTWKRGWDHEQGGIFSFRDVYGRPVQECGHDMKLWWPHAEAMIATLFAWKLTGAPRFAEYHRKVFDWSFRRFGDPVHGEWFGYLHRDGRVSTPLKGNLWKSFFHLPRAFHVCQKICAELQAGGSFAAPPFAEAAA
ncbi:MAG TPA: AGE family epimerase/isomerase [Planctomycetia bacterium]|nr:AGE family epimerase/isomerase [Planctomycetia bacterium]